MPIIKSAQKKLRQDKKRERVNLLQRKKTAIAVREFKKKPTALNLQKLFSTLDMASKKKLFHKNKVARLKSRLSLLLKKKSP